MKTMTLALVIGAAASMAACGGGGGGSGGSASPSTPEGGAVQVPTTPATPPTSTTPTTPETPATPVTPAPPADPAPVDPGTPAVNPSAPVADVPAPTYAADSTVAAVYDTLNNERSRCGFGKVAQNAQLDLAAGWHTAYLKARWNEGITNSGHLEDPGRSGYQATTAAARATLAGYTGPVGEYLSYHYYGAPKDYGNALVRTMLASVYNQIGMMDGNRDVGASVDFAEQSNPPIAILTWLNGTQPGVPLQDATDVITYPCDGSSGVQPYMYRENPDPFAGLGFADSTYVGQPIYVRAPAGKTLRLTAATMTDAAGNAVPVALYHLEQDPQRRLTAWQAFVVPRVKLAETTSYTVQVQGTTDGVAFSRQFSFSTLKF